MTPSSPKALGLTSLETDMSETKPEMRRMPISDLHAAFRAQGVSSRLHFAVKCVMCGTVQSIQSFLAAGVDEEAANREAGFSCIGRHTNAGPHKRKGKAGNGCDWTLGGLFTIHKLEVLTEDGKAHPCFEPASAQEAQALEAEHAGASA